MRGGNLRHRLRIEQVSQANTAGVPSEDWSEFATVRGSVEDLTGRELMEAQAVNARVSTRVRIRYLSGITPKHRIVVETTNDQGAAIDGRILNMVSVLDTDGRRRMLDLMCTEAL